MRSSFSRAFFRRTAADRTKDARSLAGSIAVLDWSDSRIGSRKWRSSSCSFRALLLNDNNLLKYLSKIYNENQKLGAF